MGKKNKNDTKKEKPDKYQEKVSVDFGNLTFDEILEKMAKSNQSSGSNSPSK